MPAYHLILPQEISSFSDRIRDEKASPFPEEEIPVLEACSSRRNEFRAGRRLARRLLEERGLEACVLKSMEDRQVGWPEGWLGSITHKNDDCACALASLRDYEALGIDLESLRGPSPEVWDRIFLREEREWCQGEPGAQEASALLFSAKEALYKALFPLSRGPLRWMDFRIVVGRGAVGEPRSLKVEKVGGGMDRGKVERLEGCGLITGTQVMTAFWLRV
ncbi:MAG: 4'-phosphopantetheinyl transferase superfamily protein [Blastochloris sp.]|nr:4'-phosphopantetheinyl transferase superfamily protein [Blastochloris sp.]